MVFGGGVGISLYGSHQIVTENTVFAMPKAAIEFFPDVGASFFLPSLPNHFGTYLALIGAHTYQMGRLFKFRISNTCRF